MDRQSPMSSRFIRFVWADSDVVDLGIETEKLQSNLKYGWLITVDSWKELIASRNGLKNAGRDFFAFTDPVQHYLSATGRTLFKDLPFEELKRMQLEVLSVAGVGDPGAAITDRGYNDHIISIAVSDNSGWEELIVVDPNNVEESERNSLKRLTALIKERDSDVIEGHDLFRVYLPLQRRFSPLPSVATPNCRENYRLPEVHSRWAPFRRYVFARAILRRRDAVARRF